MLFAPPRHGKSRLASELFPAWALGRDPGEQFMLCSHTADLAETFSRNVRNVIALGSYASVFPGTALSGDNTTVQRWTLREHTRPAMLAVGVGGSPTGQGARVLIIDDPIGKSEDAESATGRENVYRWYTDTIRPRLEPSAAIILMMQRWHEDDLAGRLLRDAQRDGERWDVVILPAIAEPNDPLGRAPGAPLWPTRWPIEELIALRGVSRRSFEAKYQQRPRPAEGSLFKREWLQRRVSAAPEGLVWVRYYDLAYSTREAADNTASVSGAFGPDGTIYLRGGWAGKMESPDARRKIRLTMLAERATRHGVEQAVHGGAVVQDLAREKDLAGISLRAVQVDKDKRVRATPVADRAEMGKLVFVEESVSDQAWIHDWIEELVAFPFGEHDDRVDAVSGAFLMLQAPVTTVGSARVHRLDLS